MQKSLASIHYPKTNTTMTSRLPGPAAWLCYLIASPPPQPLCDGSPPPTTSQRSSSNIFVGKKGSSTKISTCRKPLKSYQIIDNPLQTQRHMLPSITLKLSIAMIEMSSLLNKYPTLCKPKSLGPS